MWGLLVVLCQKKKFCSNLLFPTVYHRPFFIEILEMYTWSLPIAMDVNMQFNNYNKICTFSCYFTFLICFFYPQKKRKKKNGFYYASLLIKY